MKFGKLVFLRDVVDHELEELLVDCCNLLDFDRMLSLVFAILLVVDKTEYFGEELDIKISHFTKLFHQRIVL